MAGWHVGDRVELRGRVQTLGLTASRDSKRFALTSRYIRSSPPDLTPAAGLASHQLIAPVELDRKVALPRSKSLVIGDLCPLEQVLDATVFRYHPEIGLLHGLVTALRGAVRLKLGERSVIVRDLVEVKFDDIAPGDGGKRSAPPLASEDSGSLVTTWQGHVIGLLVAGRGHVGYVAPVEPLLAALGLVHDRVGIVENTDAAFMSYEAEFEREGSFGLEEYMAAA